MSAKYPHAIKPELIEIGDDIEVTLPKVDGVTHTLRGIVGKRVDHGAVRYLLTDEGYTILAWEPGKTSVKVMIHSRKPLKNESLFDIGNNWDNFIGEVSKRIA